MTGDAAGLGGCAAQRRAPDRPVRPCFGRTPPPRNLIDLDGPLATRGGAPPHWPNASVVARAG